MTTGERIKKARKEHGLTQKELAEKIGVPYQSIYQWESGTRNPKIESIRKIAEALDVSVYKILIGEDGEGVEVSAIPGNVANYIIAKRIKQTRREQRLLDHFHQLNPQGQEKAVEQVELVAKVPEYRADQDHKGKEKGPITDPH